MNAATTVLPDAAAMLFELGVKLTGIVLLSALLTVAWAKWPR